MFKSKKSHCTTTTPKSFSSRSLHNFKQQSITKRIPRVESTRPRVHTTGARSVSTLTLFQQPPPIITQSISLNAHFFDHTFSPPVPLIKKLPSNKKKKGDGKNGQNDNDPNKEKQIKEKQQGDETSQIPQVRLFPYSLAHRSSVTSNNIKNTIKSTHPAFVSFQHDDQGVNGSTNLTTTTPSNQHSVLNSTPLTLQCDFQTYLSSIQVDIKRLDHVHDEISGNKFYKLKYNLLPHLLSSSPLNPTTTMTTITPSLHQEFPPTKPTIVTFGGAFSNHIAATSVASFISGFDSIGIIRGEELSTKPLNTTLSNAHHKNKMNLFYIDRYSYRYRNDEGFNKVLKDQIQSGQGFYCFGGDKSSDLSNNNDMNKDEDDSNDIYEVSFATTFESRVSTTLPYIMRKTPKCQLVKDISQGKAILAPNDPNFFIPLFLHQQCDYSNLTIPLPNRTSPLEQVGDESNNHSMIIIPEGGTNRNALFGTSEILSSHEFHHYTHITTAVGTGGTLGGLVLKYDDVRRGCRVDIDPSKDDDQDVLEGQDHPIAQLIGFAAVPPPEVNLEHVDNYTNEINQSIDNHDSSKKNNQHDYSRYLITPDYLGKGYGFTSLPLLEFIKHFEKEYNIPLDQVYTGKMVYGVFDLIFQQKIPFGSKILMIHTGGLQGKLPLVDK